MNSLAAGPAESPRSIDWFTRFCRTDVIREALGLLEERGQTLLLQKQEIAEKITQGLNSLRSGEAVDGERVFDCIGAELDELERAGYK